MSFPAVGPPLVPFQLLEINVISAQDLAPVVSRAMRTYAVAWVHPDRKLSTRVDTHGHANPTWNDKFVFRVDESFLRSDTSAVMIEIYALSCFRDARVGNVRVLVGNLIPPTTRTHNHSEMRFVALQVRRPSGRPQGILNIGVALLDGSMRSMPLYTQLKSSAVGYRDLMGEESHSPNHHPQQYNQKNRINNLLRSRSERCSNVTDSDYLNKTGPTINGSEFGDPPLVTVTTGSLWSESDFDLRPSAVAATAPEELFKVKEVVGNTKVLEDWGEDASVEDLKTKLERWRTELPPVYDRGGGSYGSYRSNGGHARRHSDGGGLFSCFGDVYGFECSISCGLKKPRKTNNSRKGKDQLSGSDEETIPSFIIP